MPDSAQDSSWQEDCGDKAVEVSHFAGPIIGDVAAGATLTAAAAEVEAPPLAYETAMNAAGSYEVGKEIGGPVAGLAEYGVCEGGHYAGQGIQYLDDEAHQAAQAVADYISESSASNPHSENVPAGGENTNEPGSLLDNVTSGAAGLNDEASHEGHAVMENFEPLSTSPTIDDAPPAWSPDMVSVPDTSSESSGWGLASMFGSGSDSGASESAMDASNTSAIVAGSADVTLAEATPDSGLSSLFGGAADTAPVESSPDSHSSDGWSIFGGSESTSPPSESASGFFFGGSDSSSPEESSHSMFESPSFSSHDTDSSSGTFGSGYSDHDSGSSSGFGSDSSV